MHHFPAPCPPPPLPTDLCPPPPLLQLSLLLEAELRATSEHPYDYEEDDEARFRAVLRHEVMPGVLAAEPHTPQVRHAHHR